MFGQIIGLDEVDSTNSYAKTLIDCDISLPAVIVADVQTHGRGRYDRKWVSNNGNLFCSLLLEISGDNLGQLSFVTSLAVHDSIASENAGLKWPNDVLINGKKVSGILLERVDKRHLIIGVGVNIMDYPDDVMFSATSLKNEGITSTRDEFLEQFLLNFEKYYEQWQSDDFPVIRQQWLEKCAHIGDQITVKTASANISGTFNTICETGELLLTLDDGSKVEISAGDVFLNI